MVVFDHGRCGRGGALSVFLAAQRPVACTALLLLALTLHTADLAGAYERRMTVKVYNMLYNSHLSRRVNDAIGMGLNASFAARQWTVAENVTVEVVSPPSHSTSVAEFLQMAIDENEGNLFVMVGPMSDRQTLSNLPMLRQEGVVAFSPFSGSSSARGWNPSYYFLTPSPLAELLALVRYATGHLRLLRIGFMYFQGIHFGDREYKQAVKLMSYMGRKLCGVFTTVLRPPNPTSDDEFDSLWKHFVQTRPQGIICFAPPMKESLRFITRVIEDTRTRSSYLLVPAALQLIVKEAIQGALKAVGAPYVGGQVVMTSLNPLAKEIKYHAIRRFQRNAREYLRFHNGVTMFTETDDFDHDDVDGELMVYGWIAGEVLSQALSCRGWLATRETFMKSLYNQRRYVIDDLVIGDFGGECEALAAEHGAVCNCNQGGNVVYMNLLGREYRKVPLDEGLIVFKTQDCYSISRRLGAPLNAVIALSTDNFVAMKSVFTMVISISYTHGGHSITESDRVFFHSFASPSQNSVDALLKELDTRSVTTLFGVVNEVLFTVPGIAFFDPLVLSPTLHQMRRNVFYLSPTLEQQFFVAVDYLTKSSSGAPLDVVIRKDNASDIEMVLQKTAITFGRTLHGIATVNGSMELGDKLPHYTDVFVLGLAISDVTVIADHLANNKDVRMFLSFFDVAVLYHEFERVFKGHPGSDRLFFATSLPHWAEANSSSETVQKFHRAVPNKMQWTPLGLLGFAAARAIGSISSNMERISPDDFVDAIYARSVIVADDMWYGPFEDSCSNTLGFMARDCLLNYGATHISLWTMARALNASVPPTVDPVTPSMRYLDPRVSKLTGSQLGGIVGGTVCLIVLLVILLIVALFSLRTGARNNVNAPKEAKDPVTLLFTDIESSTAQWAAHPELMPDAVATHHRLIRALITRYQSYEVKTVGDSFMIACKSPFAAAQLAHDLQRCFLNNDWKTSVFDETYRELERQHAEDVPDYTPPTARLDPAVYKNLWSGLRVRVGIHTGLCEIQYDEVTKGYDYYGRTPNMAARTESVANGGQVLLTRAAYNAMKTVERSQFDVVGLGSIPLRGVPEPVELYQLNAVPGRTFDLLRVDCGIGEDGESTSFCSDGSSVCGTLSGSSLMIASSLRALFGTVGTDQRAKLLLPVCERWRVATPRAVSNAWDEALFEEVVNRLSLKVGRVVDQCASVGSRRSVSTMRSASLIIISRHGIDGSATAS